MTKDVIKNIDVNRFCFFFLSIYISVINKQSVLNCVAVEMKQSHLKTGDDPPEKILKETTSSSTAHNASQHSL